MNKYPVDLRGIQNLLEALKKHEHAQFDVMVKLVSSLKEAMPYVTDKDEVWYKDTIKLLANLHRRSQDFDNLRFGQDNGHNEDKISIGDVSNVVNESRLNEIEESFGDTWDEESLARYFNEKSKPKGEDEDEQLAKMSLAQIESWEKAQDNSNDLYKVAARVKNLARQAVNSNLTPVGDILCNSYVHVLMAFYGFAEKIQDRDLKIRLMDLIKAKEGMAADVVVAASAGVK